MTKDEIQAKALAILLPVDSGGIGASMGVGKSLIGLRHMEANYTDHARFLVAAPKKSIFKSWEEEAIKFNLEYLLPHITFTTYRSLGEQDLDYDVLYLDECHSLKYTHSFWLDHFYGKVIGLTGSPPKFKNSEKGKMVDTYCPILYTYETDEAVEDKILNDYRIVIHMVDLDEAKNIRVQKGTTFWYTSEKASYDYWSNRIETASSGKQIQMMRIMRMTNMKSFKSKEIAAKKLFNSIPEKCLMFANTQEQADRLCDKTYHSKNPSSEQNLEWFKNGNIIKLCAVEQLNEGVNIPNLGHGIILHAYGNERKASQKIGRFLRLNPDEVATVHIYCYRGTVDVTWVREALEGFDQSKITWER